MLLLVYSSNDFSNEYCLCQDIMKSEIEYSLYYERPIEIVTITVMMILLSPESYRYSWEVRTEQLNILYINLLMLIWNILSDYPGSMKIMTGEFNNNQRLEMWLL